MAGRDDRPSGEDISRAVEDSEEGGAAKIGVADGRPEPGPIVVGEVDAGPTGERGGYREATPASRIVTVGAGVIIVIAVVLALIYMR